MDKKAHFEEAIKLWKRDMDEDERAWFDEAINSHVQGWYRWLMNKTGSRLLSGLVDLKVHWASPRGAPRTGPNRVIELWKSGKVVAVFDWNERKKYIARRRFDVSK